MDVRPGGESFRCFAEYFERAFELPLQYEHAAEAKMVPNFRRILFYGSIVKFFRRIVASVLAKNFTQHEMRGRKIRAQAGGFLPKFPCFLVLAPRPRVESQVIEGVC